MKARSDGESLSGGCRFTLVVHSGFCTECGERPQNEDYVAAFEGSLSRPMVIAAVADGVGGAKGGRVAAELAVRGFIDGCLDQSPHLSAKEKATRSLDAINRWIHSLGGRDPNFEGMACTFTGIVCAGRQMHVVHVGDSRLYRLRGDVLEQLTTDHQSGPGQNYILNRAVGAEPDLRIEYIALQNETFDRYLLCTDGVHGGANKEALREILARRAAPRETATEIVNRALMSRIGDNATALIIDVAELPTAEYGDLELALPDGTIPAVPNVGTIVDNFSLDALLSDSRYARVFRASDLDDGRLVVLKFAKPYVGAEKTMREAFLREAWIASRIKSPFVGEVLHLPAGRQTRLYLAMPFYEGERLESRLNRQCGLSLSAGLDIAQKLARGIAALHRAGVIHRDIKPDNVIILPPVPGQGTGVKLVDFGVARLKQSGTTHGVPEPGTPSYMAPELFGGASAAEKSDQFALGVTVYRLFSGHYPYGEIEPFSHPKFRNSTSLASYRPDLPAWLDGTIKRAIAVDPNDRYEDVLEFMFELEHGAERASPIHIQHKPLYERNPLLFWKVISAVLAVLFALSLFLRTHGG
jgi:serine/threonine protein phosphatase PrpC